MSDLYISVTSSVFLNIIKLWRHLLIKHYSVMGSGESPRDSTGFLWTAAGIYTLKESKAVGLYYLICK